MKLPNCRWKPYYTSNKWMNVAIWSTTITFYIATMALLQKWKNPHDRYILTSSMYQQCTFQEGIVLVTLAFELQKFDTNPMKVQKYETTWVWCQFQLSSYENDLKIVLRTLASLKDNQFLNGHFKSELPYHKQISWLSYAWLHLHANWMQFNIERWEKVINP